MGVFPDFGGVGAAVLSDGRRGRQQRHGHGRKPAAQSTGEELAHDESLDAELGAARLYQGSKTRRAGAFGLDSGFNPTPGSLHKSLQHVTCRHIRAGGHWLCWLGAYTDFRASRKFDFFEDDTIRMLWIRSEWVVPPACPSRWARWV